MIRATRVSYEKVRSTIEEAEMESNWNRRDFLSKAPALAVGATVLLNAPGAALFAQRGDLDKGIEREYLDFAAQDRKPRLYEGVDAKGKPNYEPNCWGLYYRPAGKNPKTAVILMHPTAGYMHHFLTPLLAKAGYAVLGCASRWLGNDIKAVQEATLLDIAATIKFLRENYQVERIVSVGHSGGGGLYAFYQGQATTKPPGRFSSTPAGDPPDLNQFDLPPLDGMIVMAAHEGEGKINQHRLDPSVVDEDDPLITDWTLDMYDTRNGYRPYPEASKYSPEFQQRYRAAQLERSKRLNAKALELIARQRRAHQQMQSPEFGRLDPKDQTMIRRTAYFEPYMTIYRTSAYLVDADLSIDPSDSHVGGGSGSDPERPNFIGAGGQASVVTARGYLSTWSAISSRMVTNENLARITIPTLVLGATADLHMTPGIIRSSYEASAAKDKTIAFVKGGGHNFEPIEPAAGGKDTEAEAARVIADWLRPRFPA